MMKKHFILAVSDYTVSNSPSLLNIINLLKNNGRLWLLTHNVSLIPKKISESFWAINLNKIYGKFKLILLIILSRIVKDEFIFIGVDPHGYYLKKYFTITKVFYYSLELYISNDHKFLHYPDKIKNYERENISSSTGILIQSENKLKLFQEDYKMHKILSFIIPVTYDGDIISEKSFMLHSLIDVPKHKKIAIHIGGIAEWHSCIEIAIEFSTIEDWDLVFMGFPDIQYIKRLENVLYKNDIKNVHIIPPTDNLDEIWDYLKSSDVGIAWYNDISIGFRMAGESSGKIPAYFRCGLPVLAKSYKSTLLSISDVGAGVCIENYSQIKETIKLIESNYNEFRLNAISEYKTKYNFNLYKPSLLKFLMN